MKGIEEGGLLESVGTSKGYKPFIFLASPIVLHAELFMNVETEEESTPVIVDIQKIENLSIDGWTCGL